MRVQLSSYTFSLLLYAEQPLHLDSRVQPSGRADPCVPRKQLQNIAIAERGSSSNILCFDQAILDGSRQGREEEACGAQCHDRFLLAAATLVGIQSFGVHDVVLGLLLVLELTGIVPNETNPIKGPIW